MDVGFGVPVPPSERTVQVDLPPGIGVGDPFFDHVTVPNRTQVHHPMEGDLLPTEPKE